MREPGKKRGLSRRAVGLLQDAVIVILVAVDRSRVAAYLSILQKIIKWRKSLGGSAAGISPEEMARGLELALN